MQIGANLESSRHQLQPPNDLREHLQMFSSPLRFLFPYPCIRAQDSCHAVPRSRTTRIITCWAALPCALTSMPTRNARSIGGSVGMVVTLGIVYSSFPAICLISSFARSRNHGVGSFSARSCSKGNVSGCIRQYSTITRIATSRT